MYTNIRLTVMFVTIAHNNNMYLSLFVSSSSPKIIQLWQHPLQRQYLYFPELVICRSGYCLAPFSCPLSRR